MLRFLKYMLQLILSPAKGWVDIAREGESPSVLVAKGFYPFLAVVSLSTLIQRFYHGDLTFAVMLERMIVTFLMFFISYFIGVFAVASVMDTASGENVNGKRCHTFVIYSLGLLALVKIIGNILPIDLTLTYFLPIYVAIIMWKGTRYMDVEPQRTGVFMLVCILGVLAVPYILEALFNFIIS